jgi:hypothetical protein
MTEQAPVLTRHDLEAKIVKRCWQDEGFRKEFTADPARAFVKYLEVPAASLPHISVHQEDPGSWHIVLPAKPAEPGELSEQDLEKVAGGTTPASLVSATLSLIATGAASLSLSISVTMAPDNGGW